AFGGGLRDAVLQVLVEQAEGDGFQGFRGGGDLGEHVDAVLVGLDHLRDAADLAFDPPQALEIGVLVLGVAVHPSSSGPPENTMPPYQAKPTIPSEALHGAGDGRVSDAPYGYRGRMVVAEFGPLLVVLAVGAGLVLAGYGLAAALAVRPPLDDVLAFAGGLPPREHAVSRFHVRWYPVAMIFLA